MTQRITANEHPTEPLVVGEALPTTGSGYLGIKGRTVTEPETEQGGADWMSGLDTAWAPAAKRRHDAMLARSGEARTCPDCGHLRQEDDGDHCPSCGVVGRARSGRWYESRANALREPLEARVASCATTAAVVRCGCGDTVPERRQVPVLCGMRWLCDRCRKRAYCAYRARMTRALKARVAARRRAWQRDGRPRGGERRVVHMVLTKVHTDATRDRDRLQAAWERLRKWLWKRLVQTRCPTVEVGPRGGVKCHCGGGSTCGQFDYALVWETTVGDDGKPHVHAHVIALLPWVDWTDVHTEWTKHATRGESSHIWLESRSCRVQSAAMYVAKYATKGVEVGEWSPEFAASVLDAFWGKRLVSPSRGFWLPGRVECPHCLLPFEVLQVPTRRGGVVDPVWKTRAPPKEWAPRWGPAQRSFTSL